MFCPGCGIEEKKFNQFCRACGTDLRPALKVLEMPDIITASADTAREEIGRAFALKIRDTQTAKELKIVAEDVLPQIEKFLESPEEKRLRRIRVGTLISSIGLGAAIGFAIISGFVRDERTFTIIGMGIITFFIGLSFIINGLFASVPKTGVSDRSSEADSQRELDTQTGTPDAKTNELLLPEANQVFSSVTENTTQHLKEKQPVSRR
jgi:hypothetical protein